jgi:hypothetical protein
LLFKLFRRRAVDELLANMLQCCLRNFIFEDNYELIIFEMKRSGKDVNVLGGLQ